MRVLVTGASGMLGKDVVKSFQRYPEYETAAVYRNTTDIGFTNVKIFNVDITDPIAFAEILLEFEPEIIVHCAAIVAVDLCEDNKEDAIKLHSGIVSTVAAHASLAKFLYISSDSVFDGFKGNYREKDSPLPINYYAQSKFEGEVNTLNLLPNSIVVRTNIYGFHWNDKSSLAEWAIENLKNENSIVGFHDVYFNPLYTVQLGEILKELIDQNYAGIIHVGSREHISKYQFLIRLAKIFGYNQELITPKSVAIINFNAKRPLNTTLNTELLRKKLNYVPELQPGMERFYNDFTSYHLRNYETD